MFGIQTYRLCSGVGILETSFRISLKNQLGIKLMCKLLLAKKKVNIWGPSNLSRRLQRPEGMESAPPSKQSRVNNLFCYLPGVLCWVRLRFTEMLPDWNINIMVSGDKILYNTNIIGGFNVILLNEMKPFTCLYESLAFQKLFRVSEILNLKTWM